MLAFPAWGYWWPWAGWTLGAPSEDRGHSGGGEGVWGGGGLQALRGGWQGQGGQDLAHAGPETHAVALALAVAHHGHRVPVLPTTTQHSACYNVNEATLVKVHSARVAHTHTHMSHKPQPALAQHPA